MLINYGKQESFKMIKINLRGLISCFVLATTLVGCSHSNAEQPPSIITSYTPEYVQTHRFDCKSFDAEFSLRSKARPNQGLRKLVLNQLNLVVK